MRTTQASCVSRSEVQEQYKTKTYRADIDGLRAFAIILVLMYHSNLLDRGYLGVDIFFVISGYLLCQTVTRELRTSTFTLSGFLIRRVRRVMPLSLCVAACSLFAGYFLMLPDDFQNLAQSAFATVACGNNILAYLTTGDYWAAQNELKPLMHTWSLAVEEQFYLLFSLLAMAASRIGLAAFRASIVFIFVCSLFGWLLAQGEAARFYLLHYRAWEIASGCLISMVPVPGFLKWIGAKLSLVLVCVVLFYPSAIGAHVPVFLIVAAVSLMLVGLEDNATSLGGKALSSLPMRNIGLISYSIYLWHQPIFAFYRYAVADMVNLVDVVMLWAVVVAVSIVTYCLIEQPYRKKAIVTDLSFRRIMLVSSLGLAAVSYRFHLIGGVVRNVPELEISVGEVKSNIHSMYNDRIRSDCDFEVSGNKIRVLLIGNSFARDFANVLLESSLGPCIDIAYIYDNGHYESLDLSDGKVKSLVGLCDYVVLSMANHMIVGRLGLPSDKVVIVGPKDFGLGAGYYWNRMRRGLFMREFEAPSSVVNVDMQLRKEWGGRYFSFLTVNESGRSVLPILDERNRFISQDGSHLTRVGARHYAACFGEKINRLFKKK